MKVLCVLILLMLEKGFLAIAVIEGEITKCNKHDVCCLNDLVKQFTKSAVDGIPDHNIKPLDPLIISSMDFDTMQENIFHFTNLNISGMKNMEIKDVIWNLKEETAEIEIKLDFIILANLAIEFSDINKSINNIVYRTKSSPISVNTKYGFKISPSDKGVNYFTVTNETTNCKVVGDPTVNLDVNLEILDHVLRPDPELQEKMINFNRKASKIWKKQIICKIAEVAVAKLIDNFRTACRIFPATEYIKEI